MSVGGMGNVQGLDSLILRSPCLPWSPGVSDLKEDELKTTLVFLRVGHRGSFGSGWR